MKTAIKMLALIAAIAAIMLNLWVQVALGASTLDAGAARSIYIGDIVALDITTDRFSSDELREKFKAFDIVDLKKANNGYVISLRVFEPGEYSVLLGDKKIVISVGSTLADIEREEVFQGDPATMTRRYPVNWRIAFYAVASIFVISGGYSLYGALRNRRVKPQNAHQAFMRRVAALSVDSGAYFVDLTFYFKQYLENLFQIRIIGKTSTEIIGELAGIEALETLLPAIGDWLSACDRYKYTDIAVSGDNKLEHGAKLLDIADDINAKIFAAWPERKEGAA